MKTYINNNITFFNSFISHKPGIFISTFQSPASNSQLLPNSSGKTKGSIVYQAPFSTNSTVDEICNSAWHGAGI